MKYNYLLILCFCLAINSTLAQTGFKQGYIINNRHERIDCLVKNAGNEESAMNYEYRLDNNEPIEKIDLAKIEEFGIDDKLKCIRALITVEVSRNHIKSIQDTIMEWEEGHAYLKTLVEGDLASLYSYFTEGQTFYYYSLEGGSIEPLAHKEYIISTTPTHQKILYDNTFHEQLKQNLSCNNSMNAHKVSYTKTELVKYFIDYHKCQNSNYHEFESAYAKKGRLLIKPGLHLNSNQLTIESLVDAAPSAFFTKENSVGFGLELEYVIPFNRYAWSIFAEANYLSYKTDQLSLDNKQSATLYDGYFINYKTIEIPVGLSYNLNLNRNQRFYMKAAIAPHIILKESEIAFNENNRKILSSSSRLLVGLGYSFRNVGVELRYYTPQNLT